MATQSRRSAAVHLPLQHRIYLRLIIPQRIDVILKEHKRFKANHRSVETLVFFLPKVTSSSYSLTNRLLPAPVHFQRTEMIECTSAIRRGVQRCLATSAIFSGRGRSSKKPAQLALPDVFNGASRGNRSRTDDDQDWRWNLGAYVFSIKEEVKAHNYIRLDTSANLDYHERSSMHRLAAERITNHWAVYPKDVLSREALSRDV